MTWQRLESATVSGDLQEGQVARVADPLWLIGRQWQPGELSGDDAASPLLVEASIASTPVTRFQAGPPGTDAPILARASMGLPLETAVERENVRAGPAAVRLAAEAGLQLLRLLESAGVAPTVRDALRTTYPLLLPQDDGIDPVGRLQLGLLARRSFDARALYEVTAAGADPRVALLRSDAGRAALVAWMAWYAELFSEPPTDFVAWDPQRMAYHFQIAACPESQSEVVLEATEYVGGRLDWYAFDIRPDAAALGAPASIERRALRVIPTPMRYAGQAASRWWQIEDGTVFFGDINAAPEDLARIAVAAFGI